MDMIVRIVEGYGFLPIVEVDGKEVYRGEFQKTSAQALNKCAAWLAR